MRRARIPGIGNPAPREDRELLRQFGTVSRDLPSVMAAFGVGDQEAHRLLDQLCRAGYVRRDPDRPGERRWCRTEPGAARARTGMGRPLSRARADRLLQGIPRRVAEINRKPYFLCRITALGVFGEYLIDAPTIDALDLVVRIAPKPPAPGTTDAVFRPDRRLPYWRFQKLLPSDEWPRWRARHVELSLVSGTRHVVLHPFDDPRLRGQRVRLVFLAQHETPTLTPHDSTDLDGSTDHSGS